MSGGPQKRYERQLNMETMDSVYPVVLLLPPVHSHLVNLTLLDISMPLHVIPLVISSAFLLVTEFSTHVVKASDIMSGSPSFAKIAFPPAPPNGQRRKSITEMINFQKF